MSTPDLDKLQEMLGPDWVLNGWQRDVITSWFDMHMSGERSVVAQRRGIAPEGDDTTKRGTRLNPQWMPSESVRNDLLQQYPGVRLGAILEEFRDYWCAIPGQRGTKLSWDRTFRNRVREVAHLPRFRITGRPSELAQLSRVDAKAASYLED